MTDILEARRKEIQNERMWLLATQTAETIPAPGYPITFEEPAEPHGGILAGSMFEKRALWLFKALKDLRPGLRYRDDRIQWYGGKHEHTGQEVLGAEVIVEERGRPASTVLGRREIRRSLHA